MTFFATKWNILFGNHDYKFAKLQNGFYNNWHLVCLVCEM